MIIQKLASAIRRQDWFQVTIEVLIVIVGIFLGLQVQGWYEQGQDREAEQNYLVRLHEEVERVVEIGQDNYDQREIILRQLEELVDYFARDNTDLNLGSLHCNALTQSHIFFNQLASIATITEIINSGQASVLRNAKITSLISNYILTIERWAALVESIRFGSMQLSNVRPDLMPLKETADIRSSNTAAEDFECRFEAMRNDEYFPNNAFNNARRYRAYINQIRAQLDILKELHAELDNTLRLSH